MTQLKASHHPGPHQLSRLAGWVLVDVETPRWLPHLGDGRGKDDSLWVMEGRVFGVEVVVVSAQTCAVLLLVVPGRRTIQNYMMCYSSGPCSQAVATTFWDHIIVAFDL